MTRHHGKGKKTTPKPPVTHRGQKKVLNGHPRPPKKKQGGSGKGNAATAQQKAKASKKAAVDKKKAELKSIPTEIIVAETFTRKGLSLTALYRNVHANVLSAVKNIAPLCIFNTGARPSKSVGGMAWYLYWAFMDYVRENGNPVDDIPDIGTIPSFNRHWNVPIAFLSFCQAFIRNRTRTVDISGEFGDLTTLFTGTVPTNIAYGATHAQYTSAFGNCWSSALADAAREWQYATSAATFTQAQAVADGNVYSDMFGKAVGCMPFDSILSSDDDGGIAGCSNPVLCAFPTANGYNSAYPFDAEVAYMVIDATTPVIATAPIFEPYPGANQDLFVLNMVNLLNHMNGPECDFKGRNRVKFPRNIRKIIGHGKKGHQWHGYGPIHTFVVNQSNDNTSWLGLNRLISFLLACCSGSTQITNTLGVEANQAAIFNFMWQAYAFSHAVDWGWTKYTVPNGLDTTICVNAITTVSSSSFKDLNVPPILLDWVRQLAYPIVVGGKITLPSMPVVARSTLANWAGLSLATPYLLTNIQNWESVAAPNGYLGQPSKVGLFTTTYYNTTNFAPTRSLLAGPSAQFALTDANAFGTITATVQSPTLPIRLAKQFLLFYNSFFVNVTPLALFNLNFPRMGGIAYHAQASVFQRIVDQDNGWTAIEWDMCDIQTAMAVDRPSLWRATDNARLWKVMGADEEPLETYAFRASVISGDTGVLELIDGMRKDNGGLQYQSVLTGIEAADQKGTLEYKNLIALDHVIDQIHANREGPSFRKSNAYNALQLYALATKDLKGNMADIVYVGKGDGTLFAPRSVSGFLAFLTGASSVFKAVSSITGKVSSWIDSVLGLKNVTAV